MDLSIEVSKSATATSTAAPASEASAASSMPIANTKKRRNDEISRSDDDDDDEKGATDEPSTKHHPEEASNDSLSENEAEAKRQRLISDSPSLASQLKAKLNDKENSQPPNNNHKDKETPEALNGFHDDNEASEESDDDPQDEYLMDECLDRLVSSDSEPDAAEVPLKSQLNSKKIEIKRLRMALRAEETKLVLFKKLFYSHKYPQAPPQAPIQANGHHKPSVNRVAPNAPQSRPMLNTHMSGKQMMTKGQPHPLGPNRSQLAQPPSRQPQPAPMPLKRANQLNGQRGSPSALMFASNQPQAPSAPVQRSLPQSAPNRSQATSQPAQAASVHSQQQMLKQQMIKEKIKELDKSLHHIEMAKPPANDLYFLPSANNIEFLMCLGLEEVVKCVQESRAPLTALDSNQSGSDGHEATVYEFPFTCHHCSTDCSAVWRHDKNGKVLCEKCLKSIEKKKNRHEYSNRVKHTFAKLSKERTELEKQLAEAMAAPPPPPPASVPAPSSQPSSQTMNGSHTNGRDHRERERERERDREQPIPVSKPSNQPQMKVSHQNQPKQQQNPSQKSVQHQQQNQNRSQQSTPKVNGAGGNSAATPANRNRGQTGSSAKTTPSSSAAAAAAAQQSPAMSAAAAAAFGSPLGGLSPSMAALFQQGLASPMSQFLGAFGAGAGQSNAAMMQLQQAAILQQLLAQSAGVGNLSAFGRNPSMSAAMSSMFFDVPKQFKQS